MRTIIVGDVHGCLEELKELLDLVRLCEDDHLIFIGDLIDRGPQSAETVRFVSALAGRSSVQLIQGNHEEKFLRWLSHINSGSSAVQHMKGIEEFPDLAAGLGEKELAFLRSAWYAYPIPGSDWLCVHGGIPGTIRFNLKNGFRSGEHSVKDFPGLDLLNKTRYLSPDGKFVALGAEQPGWPYWAEVYDGRYGKVFFGHHPFLQPGPAVFPFASGIDTGCVYGGWLTACILEAEGGTRYLNVRAHRQYAERIRIEPT